MDKDFWQGRRVFLTGHTGFKGSWLSLWLQSLGVQLTGYALRPPTNPSLFEVANVAQGMISIEGDIRDLAHFRESMRSAQPEIVIHMAAQPLVRQSYQDPVETYFTNVMGTVNLFEAVRATPSVKAVVNVTTDKCYENREWVWGYRENDPMGGYDPYSSSKGCAELVSAAYRSSFFNPKDYATHRVAVATARAGNVIGGGDWAKHRLVPDILAAFQKETPAQIRNPHAIRPWQHVLEPLRGYRMLAEKLLKEGPKYAEAWNFGPNDQDAKPVGWLATELTKRWGENAAWNANSGHHPHEAHYLKLDISKARAELDWRPKLRIAEALDLVIDWTKAYAAGTDMNKFTLAQIASYQEVTTT
ncbi:CDP-glucose 4,6-dehydratase [beta proteobacterium MWH-UniP1]